MAATGSPPEEQSLAQLVASARQDLSDLVRDEVALAKAELKKSVLAAFLGTGLLGVAGFLGYLAALLLSVAAALGLAAAGLHPAAAFAIVAGAYLLLAGLLALLGVGRLRRARPPERTISSVQQLKTLLRRPPAEDGRR